MRKLILFSLILLFLGCNREKVFIPKPRAYPRVIYPEKSYQLIELDYCDFSFEIPSYSQISQKSKFFGEKTEHPCWFDIEFETFNGNIHCSYKEIQSYEDFEKSVQDAFKLTDKHVKKAEFIDEIPFINEQNVSGVLFLMDGPTATPAQFFATDSTQHFFRASLYLNSRVNVDSTKPIYEFLLQDIEELMATLEWK